MGRRLTNISFTGGTLDGMNRAMELGCEFINDDGVYFLDSVSPSGDGAVFVYYQIGHSRFDAERSKAVRLSQIASLAGQSPGGLHGEDHQDDVADDIKRIVEEESPAEFVGGMLVSKDTLCFHLIPQVAMQRLCERIALGEQTKGKDAWNALSDNQHVLGSREALARRFGHLINHSYHLLAKIQNKEPWTEEDEKEASAVMWGGMFAICSINHQRKQDA